jgi:hypothetical protein
MGMTAPGSGGVLVTGAVSPAGAGADAGAATSSAFATAIVETRRPPIVTILNRLRWTHARMFSPSMVLMSRTVCQLNLHKACKQTMSPAEIVRNM